MQFARPPLGYTECGLQQAEKPVLLGVNGQKHVEVKLEDSIKALIWGWQQMAGYHKLLRWAWVSRGLVTKEEMALLHGGKCEEYADGESPWPEVVPGVPLIVPLPALLQQ